MNVLYDGWSLIYAPCSPASLHLMCMLSYCPPEIQPQVALPGPRPDFLPEYAIEHIRHTGNTPAGHLQWNQLILPRLASEAEAVLTHHFSLSLPLVSKQPTISSPTKIWIDEKTEGRETKRGIFDRLNDALGQGGRSHASGVFWPADLPLPSQKITPAGFFRLPPVASKEFFPYQERLQPNGRIAGSDPDLPETYVLYHGPHHPGDLQRLLNAWSWAAGAIGKSYPLVLLGGMSWFHCK